MRATQYILNGTSRAQVIGAPGEDEYTLERAELLTYGAPNPPSIPPRPSPTPAGTCALILIHARSYVPTVRNISDQALQGPAGHARGRALHARNARGCRRLHRGGLCAQQAARPARWQAQPDDGQETLAEMEANQRCIREAEEACRWPPSAAVEEDAAAAVAADAKEAEDAIAADDARAENAAMEAQRRPVRSTAGHPPVRPDV